MDSIFNSLCGSTSSGCDTAGIWLGALLTLLVLSYLVRDSFLFRVAQSLLVGAAIGYGSAVILRTVLWDGLIAPLLADTPHLWATFWPLFFPLVLGVVLLTKLVPNWSAIGNVSLGFLFGVGAALAIGGALSGALAPQLGATVLSLSPINAGNSWFNNFIVVVGTIGALLAFRFTASTSTRALRVYSTIANAWGRLGRGFILIAFGAIFANTFAARVSVLVGQLYFLLHDWLGVVK